MASRFSAVLITLATLACSTSGSPDSGTPADLAGAQQRWDAAALQDYRFDFQQQCFCVEEQGQPVTVEVRAGQITSVVARETGEQLVGREGLYWKTIPDLFRVVAEAHEDGTTPLLVHYDPELGYPTHIEAGSLAADAGVVYSVSNLERL